ncbi:hypothetical protein PSACC_02219 [Paramicrosporidium saccamoebae]|uniref:Uncharacterized protein n=1 Tax=Paramicrosporidium saccamoebae TaxID=1246581 RepID=A0A2H9TJG1_9FUNG|nr:hypothetical protein PSACC_02219 [Paramicrosporidium saccamoebae]
MPIFPVCIYSGTTIIISVYTSHLDYFRFFRFELLPTFKSSDSDPDSASVPDSDSEYSSGSFSAGSQFTGLRRKNGQEGTQMIMASPSPINHPYSANSSDCMTHP